jgi:hypothetical protein
VGRYEELELACRERRVGRYEAGGGTVDTVGESETWRLMLEGGVEWLVMVVGPIST